MTDPTSSPPYAEAIRARRRSPREVVTWLLALAALVVFGVFSTSRDVSTATASYEEVTVTATGEFQSGERVRTRRRVSTREVRHVEVSMPDGSTRSVRSEDIRVGDEVTICRDPEGELFAKRPKVSVWPCLFSIGALAAALGVAVLGPVLWRSTGRERAGLLAAPSTPSATLQITGTDPIDDAPEASRFTAVVSGSAEAELHLGSSWDLSARNERLPEHLPRELEAHIAYRAMKGCWPAPSMLPAPRSGSSCSSPTIRMS